MKTTPSKPTPPKEVSPAKHAEDEFEDDEDEEEEEDDGEEMVGTVLYDFNGESTVCVLCCVLVLRLLFCHHFCAQSGECGCTWIWGSFAPKEFK